MKQRPVLTEEELVAYLKRTRLFTLLVEGTADAFVYRCLEDKLPQSVDILACGGRTTMLSVFKRKAEYSACKAVFIADRDMWYFSGIPAELRDEIVFTEGYSIENDLYLRETFEGLLTSQELRDFRIALGQVALWFAFQVSRALRGEPPDCKAHVNQCCPNLELAREFKALVDASPPDAALVEHINGSYHLALRGKSLFELLVRFLSHQKRQSKFSKYNLLEMGSKLPNPKATALVSLISQRVTVL